MKTKITIALVAAALIASVTAIFADTVIRQSDLPEAAKLFISKYLPNDEIRKVEKEYDFNKVKYEVDFVSGAEVDFRSDGDWKEFKAAYGNAVPAEIVPAAISTYVSENYAEQTIVEISRERYGYEVELSNGIELKLTEDGKPAQVGKGGKKR